ncbi:MAG: cupredoxin domain-containing protein [Candidatus Promineofilum sp.]|nr:cupredoxin domain-containing protein [Promineifilum sp.]
MKHLFVLMALVIIVTTGCSSGGEPAAVTPVEFTLTATDVAYDISQIEVTAGQPVKVIFNNQGTLVHDFSITEIPHSGEVVAVATETADMAAHEAEMGHMEEPDVHVAVGPGASGSVTFTPTTAGEYEYHCTVAGHLEAGMAGTLIVK